MLTPLFLMNFEDSEPRVVSLAKLHKSSRYRSTKISHCIMRELRVQNPTYIFI